MSKKVVVADEAAEGVKKKKRSKCCTCCVVFLIVNFVLLAIIFGAGWIIGDKYTKKFFGLSMGETMSVVTGLYGTKDKHVVTKPFTDSDLNGFYDEIATNLFLKPGTITDKDLQEAVDKFLDSGNEQEEVPVVGAKYADLSADEGETGENTTEEKSDVTDMLVDFISGVFTRDNIDIETLRGYPDTGDNYVFELKDKQVAAFINAILKTALKSAQKMDSFKDIADVVSLDKVVALKQIRFNATRVTKTETNELGEVVSTSSVEVATADVTVWLGLQDAAGQALKSLLKQANAGWAGGIAAWLGNVILPKNLYVTITLPLNGDADTHITLNKMNDVKRDRAYKIVNGVLSMGGGDDPTTVQSLLKDLTKPVQELLSKAVDTIDFTSASSGTIKMDLIGTLVDMVNKDLEEDQRLDKDDFMYLMQALLTTDPDKELTNLIPYRYDGWYGEVDENDNFIKNGKEVFMPADTTGYKSIDYEQRFVKEIEEKYALDLGPDDTLNDVLGMLGLTMDEDDTSAGKKPDEMLGMLNTERFHALLDRDMNDIKLRMTDRMLGSVFSKQLANKDFGLGELKVTLSAFTFVEKEKTILGATGEPKTVKHMYALLAVCADVSEMLGEALGGDNMLGSLAGNIIPDKILLSVTVDISNFAEPGGLAAGDSVDPVSFKFNDFENTDRVLNTLTKLVPDLKLDDMSSQITDSLNEMLTNLTDVLNIEFEPTEEITTGDTTTHKPGSMDMPDIFTIITDKAMPDVDIAPVELKNIIRGMDDTSGLPTESNIKGKGDCSEFIADVEDKYYLDSADYNDGNGIKTFNDLTDFIGGEFNGSKFRVRGEEPGVIYLAYDERSTDTLRPVMHGSELGALILDNMGEGSNIKDFELIEVDTINNGLVIIATIDIQDMLPDEMHKLISTDRLYVTATVDTCKENVVDGAYKVDVVINNMDAATQESTFKVIKNFQPDFDLEGKMREFGKILYDTINDLEESMAGTGTQSDKPMFTFTEDGLVLMGFYDFLGNKMDMPDESPENLKAAIQGMYECPDSSAADNRYVYNYRMDNFIFNPSTATAFDFDTYVESYIAANIDFTDLLTLNTQLANLAMPTVSDAEFNGFFYQAVAQMAGKDEHDNYKDSGVTAIQTIVLSASDSSTRATAVRGWLNDRIAGNLIEDTKDYLVITFEMDMGSFMTGSDLSNGFLPECIYATIAIEKTNKGTYDEYKAVGTEDGNSLVFNDMSPETYDVLIRLMGLNADDDAMSDDTINIKTVIKKAVDVLNADDIKDNFRLGFAPWTSLDGTTEYGDPIGKLVIAADLTSIGMGMIG